MAGLECNHTLEAIRPIYGNEEGSGAAEDEMVEEDKGSDDEIEAGAVRGPRHVRDVNLPSKAEVERHNLTHLPFRSWCPFCVKGKGKEAPHHRTKEGAGELPEVSLDFCFPSMRIVVNQVCYNWLR